MTVRGSAVRGWTEALTLGGWWRRGIASPRFRSAGQAAAQQMPLREIEPVHLVGGGDGGQNVPLRPPRPSHWFAGGRPDHTRFGPYVV